MSLLDFRDLAPGRPAYHALLRRFVLIGHPTDLTNKVGLVRNVVLIVQSFLKHGFVEFLCLVGRIKADLGFLLIFSKFSPLIEEPKFSAVDFTPPITFRWLIAYTVSDAAATRNLFATRGYPSSSALAAKAR